jgi:predicted PurR-regulated permease PerM
MNNIVLSKLSIIIMTLVFIGGLYLLTGKIILLLLPFIIGFFISKLINPAVTALHEKLSIHRGVSTLSLCT